MKESFEYTTLFERLAELSESLQASDEIVSLITAFREFLHSIIPDVDHISVNLNLNWQKEGIKLNQDLYDVINELLFPDRPPSFIPELVDYDVGERLLSTLKNAGFPLDRYKPPTVFNYTSHCSYLGTLIVWQDVGHKSTADAAIETIGRLEPIIKFVLTDIVARHHQANPIERSFFYGVSTMSTEIEMSGQECRVAILQLYGLSYDQTADRLGLSVNTIRKHLMSVYRKAEVHSLNELFAKYFTPARLRYK